MAIMIEVLEHIETPAKAMRILRDALNESGHALITVPNANRYRRREESLNNMEWTPSEFLKFLKQYFKKVWLLDSDLIVNNDIDTRESPIIAGVSHAR